MNENLKDWSENNIEREKQVSFRANGDENGIEIYFKNDDFEKFSIVMNCSGPTDVKIMQKEGVLCCFGLPFSCLENIVDSIRGIKSKSNKVGFQSIEFKPFFVGKKGDLISDLEISPRTYKALINADVHYISQAASLNSQYLLRISGFGRKGLNELRKALKERDCTLK